MRHRFAPLGKFADFLAILHERAAQSDHPLACAQAAGHFYRVAEGLSDLDDLRFGIRFSIAGNKIIPALSCVCVAVSLFSGTHQWEELK